MTDVIVVFFTYNYVCWHLDNIGFIIQTGHLISYKEDKKSEIRSVVAKLSMSNIIIAGVDFDVLVYIRFTVSWWSLIVG